MSDIQTATFAGGCFWCTEAIFRRLKGVRSVTPGYAGGKRENPSYEQVSAGATGHAEAIQITFDPAVITYHTLLEVFFATHDPTTLNRQGADTGTQYRSVIFYHTGDQQQAAEEMIRQLSANHTYSENIVTEVVPVNAFYPAEDYHQNYYDTNRQQPYCRIVIDPKIRKLLDRYSPLVKNEYKT